MTQDQKRQVDEFLRPQIQSKYYERTGIDLEANKTVKNYYPLVQDIYAFLRKEERYIDQNIELVDKEKDDIKIKKAMMSLVSANNLKSLMGQQKSVGDATYPILFDYVGVFINFDSLRTEEIQQLFKREGTFGIAAYKTKLEKRGIKEAGDWHKIRKVVRNGIKKGKIDQLCCISKSYQNHLEDVLTNQLADKKVVYPFFNTLNYFLESVKKQKSAINRYKGEIKAAKKKIKDTEASKNEQVKAENIKKDYQRRLQNIFIEDYSERFIGKKIATQKAVYTIEKQVHKGKFSVIWEATATWKPANSLKSKNKEVVQFDQQKDPKVVIKMLRSIKNIGFKQQVIEGVEVQKLACQLFNKGAGQEDCGVIEVYDGPYEEAGFTFFVMEFAEGQTMKAWLKEQKEKTILGKEEFIAQFKSHFQKVCTIVDRLHQNEIQHLDLSPDNIHIRKDGKIVLSDFDNVQYKGHHYNGSFNYMEMASQDFLPDTLKEQKELSPEKAKQADIYALTRIMMNAFLIGIGQEEGWQGNHHNNENTIKGPRFRPYKKELKEVLHKGTQFDKNALYTSARELMEASQDQLNYQESPWYRQLDIITKISALVSLLVILFSILFMLNLRKMDQQSKHIEGLGYYISANTAAELENIQDFENLYEPAFIKTLATFQQLLLTESKDTNLTMQLDRDVLADYELSSKAPNETTCISYGPLATKHKFCYGYSTLTPTINRRIQLENDSLKQSWLSKGQALFGHLQEEIKRRGTAIATEQTDVPTHLSSILGFEKQETIKPILLYAIIETDTDSIMYRYPFYSKDLSNYHFPVRPWYLAITDKNYGNQPIYLQRLQQQLAPNWSVGISPLYPDIKAGFLPIRTLFLEKQEADKRYLLLIDFMYKYN